jgi:hypothetical protein
MNDNDLTAPQNIEAPLNIEAKRMIVFLETTLSC